MTDAERAIIVKLSELQTRYIEVLSDFDKVRRQLSRIETELRDNTQLLSQFTYEVGLTK